MYSHLEIFEIKNTRIGCIDLGAKTEIHILRQAEMQGHMCILL